MTDLRKLLEPRNEAEREEDAICNFLLRIQLELQMAMNQKGVSQKELSERLGVSQARVSQIFSSTNANMSLRTIGRVMFALDEDFDLVRRKNYRMGTDRALEEICGQEAASKASRKPKNRWTDLTANDNRFPQPEAA